MLLTLTDVRINREAFGKNIYAQAWGPGQIQQDLENDGALKKYFHVEINLGFEKSHKNGTGSSYNTFTQG